MRNLRFRILAVSLVALAACSKELKVPAPSFAVTGYEVAPVVDSLGQNVSQVTFRLSGDPDIISFYSGEAGNDYQYKDGRLVDYAELNLSFDSNFQYGVQPDQFSVWLSTDFSGEYTFDKIKEASWTDITGGFELPTGSAFKPSGPKNIQPYLEAGKPLYIAFKYTCQPASVGGTPNIWRVNNFSLTGKTDIGDILVAEQKTASWLFASDAIDDNTRARLENNGNVFLANGNTGDHIDVYNESWAVTKPLNLDVIDNGPDGAVPIKNLVDLPLTAFTHNYVKSGHYTAVFIAKNAVAEEEKQIVASIDIQIP